MSKIPSLSGIILQHQALLWVAALFSALHFNGIAPWALALTLGGVLLVGTAVLWQGYELNRLSLPTGPLTWCILLYWAWLGLTSLWSPLPYLSTTGFWWLGLPALIFLTLTLQGQETVERIWEKITFLLMLLGLWLCVDILYDLYLHQQEPLGPFLYRNSLASFLAMLLLPILGQVLNLAQQRRMSELLFPGMVAILLLHLILTINSLGVFISLGVAGLVLVWGGKRWVEWRAMAILAAVVLAGMALHGMLEVLIPPGWTAPEKLERVLTVIQNPGIVQDAQWQQQSQRALLLQGGWRMFLDAPWYGFGVGSLWLLWPPYQHPYDISSGFYLHCDPLQIAVEAGIPGVLLFLGIFVAASGRFAGMQRQARTPRPGQGGVEAVALYAALCAMAVHSCFDFDAYVLQIMFLVGLYLARFALLSGETRPIPVASLTSRSRYRLFSALIMGTLLLYVSSILISDLLYGYGNRLANRGDLLKADQAMAWSTRLAPYQDNIRFAHASLFIALTERESEYALRQTFFSAAMEIIDAALESNPYRWGSYFMRGNLLRKHPDLAGEAGMIRMEEDFRHALRLNPRYVMARVMLAKVLWARGDHDQARQVLMEGLDLPYPSWLVKVDESRVYYEMVLEKVPDKDGSIRKKVEEMAAAFSLPRPKLSGAKEGAEQVPTLSRVDLVAANLS